MLRKGKALLSLFVMGLAAWAFVTALGWPQKAALFPLVISAPLFLLALAEFCIALWGSQETQAGSDADFVLSQEVPPALAFRRTIVTFAWIAGFLLLIVAIGFVVAVPVFVFLYLKIQAREKWLLALVLAGLGWAFMYGAFVWLLDTPFDEGLILGWLAGVIGR